MIEIAASTFGLLAMTFFGVFGECGMTDERFFAAVEMTFPPSTGLGAI